MKTHRFRTLLASGLLSFCSTAFAGADGSQVPLPDGVNLAIVIFEDLQCPDCGHAHPELVRADFDLGMKIKLEYVPLIFVTRRDGTALRAVEVTDLAKLGDTVAEVKRN